MKTAVRYFLYSVATAVVIVTFGFAVIYAHNKGVREGHREVFRDMSTAASITASAKEASPQLREFSKAQMYYFIRHHNIAILSPQMQMIDLGPVDEKLIVGTMPFLPHADSPNDYHQEWK